MRGRSLLDLLDGFRAEARLSLNPAQNAQDREAQVRLLKRIQEDYWEDFDWPHLRVERQVPIAQGQRFYDVPEDLPLDRIERIELQADGVWCQLVPEIGAREYAAWNSDLGEQSWPPRRWKIWETEQIEIWPIANMDANATTRDGYLKFTGIRYLKKLVDDADVADLDDRLISVSAAAERLAAQGSKDAKIKLEKAAQRYAKLRAGLTARRRFRMFGVGGSGRGYGPGDFVGTYRPPYTPTI